MRLIDQYAYYGLGLPRHLVFEKLLLTPTRALPEEIRHCHQSQVHKEVFSVILNYRGGKDRPIMTVRIGLMSIKLGLVTVRMALTFIWPLSREDRSLRRMLVVSRFLSRLISYCWVSKARSRVLPAEPETSSEYQTPDGKTFQVLVIPSG